ncbi:MAG TPA: SRPBCC domain-containing protein [Telluria sp.]|nr:SRPBCC domain-containing protein [Telluria sp.]
MSMSANARALVDLNAGTIVATVTIDAPVERVYRALASQEVTKWWGADGSYRTTRWEADTRVGGAWRAEGTSVDRGTFSVYGEFLEVDPPHKLSLSWNHDWDDCPPTTVTYLLDAVDGGTKVTVHHTGFGTNKTSCQGHANGWEAVLQWLSNYVRVNR